LGISDFDYNAAFEYGMIRTELENNGKLIGPMDILIASHARSLNMTLVTNNEKEFKRVENLRVENWID
jgi:tRNA(fMet)-specific endonuclease VapC